MEKFEYSAKVKKCMRREMNKKGISKFEDVFSPERMAIFRKCTKKVRK
jgi:hypothetical protein